MRILITGGAGLVGSHCAEYFAKRGSEVIVLDNLARSSLFGYDKKSVEFNWNYLARYKNIQRVYGDVQKRADILYVLGGGLDVVIHTAGQPGVPLSVKIPSADFRTNAYGTLNVLECVRQRCKSAKFIYCSTNKVYGENVGNKIVPEHMSIDLTGHTPYGVSKLVGDLYTQEYAHIYGMRTAVFRMSCTTGIRQFGFEEQGWVTWFIVATLLNKPITIYGDGNQVRDILYVTDLVRAFDKFIQGDIRHGVFNIGGGIKNTTSLLEFLKLIKRLTGKKTKITFSDWRPSDQKKYVSDITKVKKALKWRPKIRVEEGAERIVRWVKNNKDYFK